MNQKLITLILTGIFSTAPAFCLNSRCVVNWDELDGYPPQDRKTAESLYTSDFTITLPMPKEVEGLRAGVSVPTHVNKKEVNKEFSNNKPTDYSEKKQSGSENESNAQKVSSLFSIKWPEYNFHHHKWENLDIKEKVSQPKETSPQKATEASNHTSVCKQNLMDKLGRLKIEPYKDSGYYIFDPKIKLSSDNDFDSFKQIMSRCSIGVICKLWNGRVIDDIVEQVVGTENRELRGDISSAISNNIRAIYFGETKTKDILSFLAFNLQIIKKTGAKFSRHAPGVLRQNSCTSPKIKKMCYNILGFSVR